VASTPGPAFQRNAFAPSLLAAAVLFLSPVLLMTDWSLLPLFTTTILAVIIGWFALQARQWWWVPVFAAIAVVWNPVVPFPFEGPIWTGAQFGAAVVFLIAGVLIRSPRA